MRERWNRRAAGFPALPDEKQENSFAFLEQFFSRTFSCWMSAADPAAIFYWLWKPGKKLLVSRLPIKCCKSGTNSDSFMDRQTTNWCALPGKKSIYRAGLGQQIWSWHSKPCPQFRNQCQKCWHRACILFPIIAAERTSSGLYAKVHGCEKALAMNMHTF